MVVESIIALILTIIDLVKDAVLLSIPVFVLVWLGSYLKNALEKRYKLSWIVSVFIVIYIITTLLIFLLYFGFYAFVAQGYDVGVMPEQFMLSFEEAFTMGLTFLVIVIFKKLFAGLALSLIALPFAFVSSFIREMLVKKYKKINPLALLFAGVFGAVLLALIIFLSFQWIITGVIYLMFFF
jgi:hypothetical protein